MAVLRAAITVDIVAVVAAKCESLTVTADLEAELACRVVVELRAALSAFIAASAGEAAV